MDFGKISQQTCFERGRIKRILGRAARFPAPALPMCSVPIYSMRTVSQKKAMSHFTFTAGYNWGSSIKLGANIADNAQTLCIIKSS